MSVIFRLLGKGVIVLLPIIILLWFLSFIFGFIKGFVEILFDTTANSVSATIGILLIMVILLIYSGYLFEKNKEFLLVRVSELLISKIPGVATIYTVLKDIVKMFSGKGGDNYLGVAYIDLAGNSVIGFITKEEEGFYWIFVPTTPNPTSGILLRAHSSKVQRIDMSVSEGLKKVVSLGIK
ncbi:DUF502 domain-containing protein [Helicobacter cappadocius]|uniref:DUF502 domain-containing protein n=1 Tax=Helicobacter cappadocius TaxID=3063998 RepID=A0AA90PJI0_9HELI|nr:MULTISPECIES: DUF502 domain-containing protein [unclassified Helicobacter]MDO7253490.1 DUF502 domain-containing protein [Helicobacter sp. faydin-H75]MDP2539417.1 DUF502 domain-containing protein [Helicobacter sp. faydin-H76]